MGALEGECSRGPGHIRGRKRSFAPMPHDDDRLYPLKVLGEPFGLTERELETAYRNGKLELYLVAGKLKGSRRQVREMLKRCRVRKGPPGSCSSPPTVAAEPSGSSRMERSAKAQAAFNKIAGELKKNLHVTSQRNGHPPKH